MTHKNILNALSINKGRDDSRDTLLMSEWWAKKETESSRQWRDCKNDGNASVNESVRVFLYMCM